MDRRLLRWPAVQGKIGGLSRVHVWRLEREGRFLQRVALSDPDKCAGGAYGPRVGWFEHEVDEWLAARVRVAGRAQGQCRADSVSPAKRGRERVRLND
jgi:predicted DNA-binding transcriptional regulator AlpA